MNNAIQERQLGQCFYLSIDLDNPLDVCLHEAQRARRIEQATKRLIDGTASPDDFLDLAELAGLNMDTYIDEVSNNIEFLLNDYYR